MGVVVGIVGAAGDGVGGQEATEVGVVEADTHEGEVGEGVAGALLRAEPAVARVGGGGEVRQAELGGFGVAGDGAGRRDVVDGRDDIAVQVGQMQDDGTGVGLGGGEVPADTGDVPRPAGPDTDPGRPAETDTEGAAIPTIVLRRSSDCYLLT
ncbi:hypothetical protein MXD62_33115 [Frankia sp. Mgl5]|uniref:hypothetical protein n=1 Tax=Frankia sp. Mgl5 TaxID=2933793 RepID=UPI00200CEF55|nr:hypothetical protein [Frankia sp. Mgl5]MCK9931921.1 hypothetical protein [Frankia sp. Mgl5]